MPETLITAGLAKTWISKLWKQWSTIREERRQELLEIEKDFVSLEQLEMLARLYIEPECQATNPADHDEDEPERAVRQPIHGWINGFLKGRFRQQDGRNTVFVLSDAGMGKSSLLMMLKLSHLSRFWPREVDFKLLKLGPKTLEVLDGLRGRGRTVLLLDALDEDPTAWGRIGERLGELLDATKSFRQVILTCRTQFFPKGGKAAIEKAWKVEVGGWVCNLLYLSPFSDEQVEEYLRKVFPDGWRERLKWITKQEEPVRRGRARRAVMSMRSLRMRPMLLAHVHDLMEDDADQWTEYRVYHTLVERWLLREERKQKGKVKKEELWDTCTTVALHLQAAGKRVLALKELGEVVGRGTLAERLEAFDFGGRSLLNRTSERGFRFAHYSIQEFLIAHTLLTGDSSKVEGRLHATDQLTAFLLAWVTEDPRERLRQVQWGALDFQDVEVDLVDFFRLHRDCLRGARLRGMPLRGADLGGWDLRGVDLRDADLREADLRKADFSFGCLARADLRGARLSGAVTVGTGFLATRGLDAEIHRSAGPPQPRMLRAAPQIGHGGLVNCIAWSPDGRLLASGSYDKTVGIWDAASGRRLQTLKGHENGVLSVAWDPSGERLASGSYDKTVGIWDAASGRRLQTLQRHKNPARSVTWDQSGDQAPRQPQPDRCDRSVGRHRFRVRSPIPCPPV